MDEPSPTRSITSLKGRLVEVVWDVYDGEDYEVRIVRPEDTNLTPQEFAAHYALGDST